MGTPGGLGHRMIMGGQRATTKEAPVGAPFVGPVALHEGQRIYGRSRETRELADLLVSERIVVLMSPSGAGKTSLIHAGLLPLLRARRRNPFRPLPTVRLAQSTPAGEGNAYVHAALRQLEAERPADDQLPAEALFAHSLTSYFRARFRAERHLLLLVLDQFEELFTLRRSDTEAKHVFIAQLSDLLAGIDDDRQTHDDVDAAGEARVPVVWALISMREDFLAELEPLRARMPTGLAFVYRLLPLDREAAFQAVYEPAEGRIAPDAAYRLVDDLRVLGKGGVDDAADAPSRYGRYVEPMLLQVSCLRLWDRVVVGEARSVTADDIEGGGRSGQVDAALGTFYATVVETAARETGIGQRELRDFIEYELITASRLRARPRRDPHLGATMNAAIGVLERQHLLRIETDEGGEIVELVHDRLIAPILADNESWREANLSLVQKAAALWEKAGRPREMLLYGESLDRCRQQVQAGPESFTAIERAFIEASVYQRQRLRRERGLRRSLIGLCAVLTVMCVAVTWLYAEVEAVRLRHLGAELRAHGRPDANDELFDVASRGSSDLVDGAMMQVLGGQAPAVSTLMKHDDIVRSLAFAPDGSRVYSGERGGRMRVASFPRRGHGATPMPDVGNVGAMAVHPGGKLIAIGETTGWLSVWRTDGDAQAAVDRREVARDGRPVTSVAFNGDGSLLAAATYGKRLSIQRVSATGHLGPEERVDTTEVHKAPIYRIAFVPGKAGVLVSGDWDGNVGVWSRDGSTGKVRLLRQLVIETKARVATRSLAISPNGRWLAVGDSKGALHLWDLDHGTTVEGRSAPAATNHVKWVTDLAFSPDGKTLVSTGLDGVLKRYVFDSNAWTAENAIVAASDIGGWGEKLYSVEFSPSSSDKLAVGGSRYVRSVDLDGLNALASRIDAPDALPPRDVAMSGDGNWVLALRDDGGAIDAWRRGERGEWKASPSLALAARARRIAMSPDAKSVAILRGSWDQVDIVAWGQGHDDVRGVSARVNTCQARRDPNAEWGDTAEPSLAFDPTGRFLVMLDEGAISLRRQEHAWAADTELMCGFPPFAFRGDGMALAFLRTAPESGNGYAFPFLRTTPGMTEVVLRWTASMDEQSAPRGLDAPKVRALAFSPDGDFLIEGLEDGGVWAWQRKGNTFAGKQRQIGSLLHADVTALAYVPGQGHVLLTADRDGTLGVCRGNFAGGRSESTKPQCGEVADMGASVQRLIVAANGKAIVVADHIYAMDLSHDAMLDHVSQLAWCKGADHGECAGSDP